ncbi:MAG: hypothetical protein KBA61_04010 [Spirochaetes bacterium]|nr:hypothetical protein [Spirochaetota bacterium]
MNISSGISEIRFGAMSGIRPRDEKVYIWPVYGEGRVERVQGVTRRTEGNAIYSKPLPEERAKLLDLIETSSVTRYTQEGRLQGRISSLQPGSFFDAIV